MSSESLTKGESVRYFDRMLFDKKVKLAENKEDPWKVQCQDLPFFLQ